MKTSLKLYFTALVASFLLLLGACSTNSSTSQTETSSSAPTEVTIKSSLDEVKLSKVPEKIVTFDLGAADTIRALGFEKNIVGMPTKTVPTYLKDLVGTVKNVGSMKEPDLEAIAALEPDLIIASPRTQKFVDKFKEIAPNEGKMAAFGAKSRFSFLYQTLKFKPTDTTFEDSRHGQEVSFESVKEINPDILFVINRTLAIGGDNSSNDGVLENALIAETPAAKNGKIIQLTPDLWYLSGGGLESTKLMIEDIQKALK